MTTKTNANTDTNTNDDANVYAAVSFQAQDYVQFLRSASANRVATFSRLYGTTLDYDMFRNHAESIALTFSTVHGIDTTTLGLVSLVSKLPKSAFIGLETKAKLNVQTKPTLILDDEFAKLLIQFLTALATVVKYCNVS